MPVTETIANPQKIVEDIRREIEDARGTHIWDDYVNALRLISQVVFTRSSGFILELLQNAEDAGQGLSDDGTLEISFNQQRVKVAHNGRPFSQDDVRAISGIRSSKKPESGFLGYLGIGFKSILKVSDCPEIYSNGFRFKFDRTYWPDPGSTPWHVIPIWLDTASEPVDDKKTTFIIPFREGTDVTKISTEIQRLRLELYLFLRWLRRIKIINETSGKDWVLENLGEDDNGITRLNSGTDQRRFRFFRRTVPVPDWVTSDRLTQEYRSNVKQREIAVGFALDRDGNLSPDEAGAMYGGVYSFLPLGEAKSGAKFPIQADFLVQPGRDAINYEAPWNHWLLGEVASLCVEAIEFFRSHEVWKYQFLPAFEFAHSPGLEAYDKLFYPKLIKPVEEFLQSNECVLTVSNEWAKSSDVIRLMETEKAISQLMSLGLFTLDQVAPAFGGEAKLKLLHPKTREPKTPTIKRADRWSLLSNSEFLAEKAREPNSADWFRSLYLWLSDNPLYDEWTYRRRLQRRVKTYHEYEFVLTSQCSLKKGGEVFIPDLSSGSSVIHQLGELVQTQKPIIHPALLSQSDTTEAASQLKGFLTGLAGCQLLNTVLVCKEALLPTITTKSPTPQPDDLLRLTIICKEILGSGVGPDTELWVLTKDGDIKASKEVLLSSAFKPARKWDAHDSYVPGLSFASPNYIAAEADDDMLRSWREFFRATGVKDSPDNGVEQFAINFALERLESKFTDVQLVEKLNYGFDIQARTAEGSFVQIEVKGVSGDQDVELTRNEVEAADTYKDSFYVCVVASIPNAPTIHFVRNPASVGKKDKLTIPADVWKAGEEI